MKSALVGPVVMFALAVLSYLISREPIISISFAGIGVLLLLLLPLSIRAGKRWERRLQALDELADERERKKRP